MTSTSSRCEYTHLVSCGYCSRNSKPWLFTPTPTWPGYFSRMNDRATALDAARERREREEAPTA